MSSQRVPAGALGGALGAWGSTGGALNDSGRGVATSCCGGARSHAVSNTTTNAAEGIIRERGSAVGAVNMTLPVCAPRPSAVKGGGEGRHDLAYTRHSPR